MTRPLDICVLGAASSPHVINRALVFQERGHDVRLISPVPGAHDRLTIIHPGPLDGGRFVSRIKLLLWSMRTIYRQKAQIYHAHYAAEVGTWLAWLFRKRPLAITVMGGDILFDEQGTLGPLGRWLTRRAVKGADYVTTKTDELAETATDFGARPDRVETVIWGIDPSKFRRSDMEGAAYRASLGIALDQAVVLSPRMLQPFYNIENIVEAWPAVISAQPDAILILSTFRADAQLLERLKNRITELGLERSIVLAPALAAQEMVRAYSAADAVISIPPSDGFPQAVLEAAACDCPLILSDLERLHSVLPPESHAVYTETMPGAVAKAVISVLSDPKGSAARAARARQRVEEAANFHENADRVEQRFQQLVDAG